MYFAADVFIGIGFNMSRKVLGCVLPFVESHMENDGKLASLIAELRNVLRHHKHLDHKQCLDIQQIYMETILSD